MKITIDKEFTAVAQVPRVKEDIKEFKARYTENDLLSAFWDTVNIPHPYGHSVILSEIDAFPSGWTTGDKTSFHVQLVTRGFREFLEISFYCDLDLNIDTRPLYGGTGDKLYSQRYYSCKD